MRPVFTVNKYKELILIFIVSAEFYLSFLILNKILKFIGITFEDLAIEFFKCPEDFSACNITIIKKIFNDGFVNLIPGLILFLILFFILMFTNRFIIKLPTEKDIQDEKSDRELKEEESEKKRWWGKN